MTSIQQTTFEVRSQAAGRAVLQRLRERWTVARGEDPRRQVTYFDTFEWHLHRDGGVLRLTENNGSRSLSWQALDGRLRHRARVDGVPRFAWELPPGPLAEALGQLIKLRRLLPVARLGFDGQALRVLDAREKTVVRIALEQARVARPGHRSRAKALPWTLRVESVRGYEPDYQRLVHWLGQEVGLSTSATHELDAALVAIHRRSEDYSSKPRYELHPGMSGTDGARAVHRALLAIIRANEEGLRQDLDTEFLHQFRVAVRKTRSALAQLPGVFEPGRVEHFRVEFRWLQQSSGPLRDLDVYLLKMGDYRESLPDAVRPHLAPLEGFLRRQRRLEHRQLVRALGSKRYRALIDDWGRFLDESRPAESETPNAARPFEVLAAERIRRIHRRVLERGAAIDRNSPARKLHRLRIDCKKLRYLLEFASGLFGASATRPLIRALQGLQDNLGEFNDLQVQQDALGVFAEQMLAEGEAAAETLLAMGRLVAGLERRQAKQRRRFQARFAEFASVEHRAAFRALAASTSDPHP